MLTIDQLFAGLGDRVAVVDLARVTLAAILARDSSQACGFSIENPETLLAQQLRDGRRGCVDEADLQAPRSQGSAPARDARRGECRSDRAGSPDRRVISISGGRASSSSGSTARR